MRWLAGARLTALGWLLLVALWPGSGAPSAFASNHLVCHHPIEQEARVQGHFVDHGQLGGLYLRTRPFGRESSDFQCYLQHDDGPTIGFEWDAVHLMEICRDPVTGLDVALLRRSMGKYSDVEFWSVDPGSLMPTLEYGEPWYDHVTPENRASLIQQGECRYHTRRDSMAQFREAMSELGTTGGPRQDDVSARSTMWGAAPGADIALVTRAIPRAVATQWLSALAETQPRIATFETARYIDRRARTRWWVLQVLGTQLENAPGVVLLQDRTTGQWHAIYDVFSGGSHLLNYPLESMTVKGDMLLARACVWCAGRGRYRDVRINLKTRTAVGIEVMPEFVDRNRQNPEPDHPVP